MRPWQRAINLKKAGQSLLPPTGRVRGCNEKLDGDALDRDTIQGALVGVDAVIQTLGASPAPELVFSGTRLFSAATRVLVNAMEASGVRRLICVTGLGAGDSRGRGGILYNAALCLNHPRRDLVRNIGVCQVFHPIPWHRAGAVS
jgi:hypothetical protein